MEQVPETVPAPIPTIFDVFINHRGPDVKNTIASLIYHRLKNSGYKVFLDKNEINPGDIISPAIHAAIESASVHVAIFSERYAESTWCLEELHLMLKSLNEKRRKIITIFSNVEPRDLRHIERGCYGKSFENHEQKGIVSKEDLEKWKKALDKASHISGLLFKTKESDYGDFLEDVAKAVIKLIMDQLEGIWKQELNIMPKDIMDRLEGIYDSLGRIEKKLFLDIGCFLVGEEKELATRVLEGLYDNTGIDIKEYFESLRSKYLVDYKIECRKREDPMIALTDSCRNLEMIAMPNPLRKFSRDIARQNFGTTQALRLSSEKDIEAVSKTTSNHQIQGIRFSKQPTFREGIRVNSDGVRLFVAEGRVDLSSFFDSWKISGELVWLRLGNLSYFHFPPSISLQTLRVLELEGPDDSVQHFFRNFNHDAGRRELNTVDAGASTWMGRLGSIFRFWQNGSSIFRNWKRQTFFQYLESRVTGMETLTNLELKNITSLRSLPIDFSRLRNLTQLDLSGCVNLTALPSLSNLVILEFLNINGCSNLEILNLEGLTSLKEIKAEACWKLKSINDLTKRERLNCLLISTDDCLIWNNICQFLKSRSHQKPLTAIFSGRADDVKVVNNQEMIDEIARVYHLKILDLVSDQSLKNVRLYSAIMIFFIADEGNDDASSPEFCVTILPNHIGTFGSALEYRTARANRVRRSVNVLMFKECKSGIHVSCSHLNRIQEGRIVMVDKNSDVPSACEAMTRAYASIFQ